MKVLQPPGWPRPKGYSNGIAASGRTIWTAGVIGWDETETLVSDTLAGQFEQILRNTLAILAEAGAGPEHVVRMTWYVTDRDEYVASLKEIGASWRAHMGKNYPTMAVVAVAALVEPGAKIEIETTAVVPEG
ncbi:MAG TPA: RidA family protein [Allosphingosinicella sp.]|jgi:enamine deaminase RidA (YjgF/YER057c/UK114 family)|nr:RidA family protein [Allosphingosinicella sp.]